MRDELRRFIEFKPSTQAQCRVIDAFIFSCFTGLSFSDVKRLTMADIVRRNDRYYVSTYRKKTGTSIDVPLLQLPYSLINRDYADSSRPLVDLPSNNWCNTYCAWRPTVWA